MKGSLSAIDLHHIGQELSEYRIKIDQVYIYDKKHIVLRLYIRDHGKQYLRIELPNLVYLSQNYPPAPQRASNQSMFFRRHLSGLFVNAVRVVERTLMLDLVSTQKKLTLVFEFFDKGNMILLEDGMIKGLLEQQSWSSRVLKKGEVYEPVQREFSLRSMPAADFVQTIDTDMPVSKLLATQLGLGGEYANELCAQIEKDPKMPGSDLGIADWEHIKQLLEELYSNKDPRVYLQKIDEESYHLLLDDVVSVSPIVMKQYEKPSVKGRTFLELLDRVFGQVLIDKHHSEQTKEQTKQLSKTERILQQLDQQEKQLLQSIDQYQKTGEFLYEHFADIEGLLKDVVILEKQDAAQVTEKYPKLKYNGSARTITFQKD